MISGLISIGTNSTRALVVRTGGGRAETLLHRSTGTRIGEGLRERGHLDEAAMQRTLDAIGEHAAAIREHTADFGIIATSALRRADNERAFDERVRALTGTRIEIISGEEEAACSYAGALSGIAAGACERFGVLDVGGGSSEYAVGTKTECERTVSCEVGAVRLTERFPQLAGGPVQPQILEAAAAFARAELEPALRLPPVDQLLLVGGSATTAVSLVRAKREPFEYFPLHLCGVREWLDRLTGMPLEDRKALPGMNPQRADILPAGLLIITEMASRNAIAGRTPIVSTNDVLLGYVLRHPA